uniref:aminomethyltransferase n=1 Tax=Emiliania huxleyi TaxID=2903 RepID=A0A7S3RPT8_EMIHU
MPAESELRKTPLHAEHLALGAKMGPFGGWDMPIQYPDGIMKSHLFTRAKAGLFDVSHMLGVVVRGADRVAFMESLCTADIQALPDGSGTLSLLTNEAGGIIDDMIITNAGDHLYMVINAGHEDKDLPHMEAQLSKFVASGKDASVETLPNNGILALQGPAAAEVLQALTPVDLSQMPFMSARPMEVAGEQCFVARSGCETGMHMRNRTHAHTARPLPLEAGPRIRAVPSVGTATASPLSVAASRLRVPREAFAHRAPLAPRLSAGTRARTGLRLRCRRAGGRSTPCAGSGARCSRGRT